MAQFNQTTTFAGLGTLSLTAPVASIYFLDGKTTLPTLPKGDSAPSACLVTVNQNASPVYTGQAGAEGFHLNLNCAANDAITVVFSSAAAVDQGLNVIKSVVAFGTGE